MRATSLAAVGQVAAAGSSSHKQSAAPIKHTILGRLRFTDTTVLSKVIVTGSSSTAGTAANDTTAPEWAGQTGHVRFSGYGTTGGAVGAALPSTWDLTSSYVRWAARISQYSALRNLFIRFAETKTTYQAGNFLTWKVTPYPASTSATANWYPPNTWVWDSVHPAFMTTNGSGADPTKIGYVAFYLQDNASSPTTVIDLGEVQQVQMVGTKAKCVIWHDDLVQSGAFGIRDKLNAYGWAATEATEWEMIDAGTVYMYSGDVTSLRALGWRFGSHATTSPEHAAVPAAAVQNQAYRNKIAARGRGLAAEAADFAWWGGLNTTTGFDPVSQNYRSGRWFINAMQYPDFQPPANPFLMRCLGTATGDTFASTWQPLLTNAIAVKGIAQICFHQQISQGATGADVTEFDNLLAWLDQNRASIDVVTIGAALAASTA